MSDVDLLLFLNCTRDPKGRALQRAVRAERRRRNPAAVTHAYEVVTIAETVANAWRVVVRLPPRRRAAQDQIDDFGPATPPERAAVAEAFERVQRPGGLTPDWISGPPEALQALGADIAGGDGF